jgi:hypothetical protein
MFKKVNNPRYKRDIFNESLYDPFEVFICCLIFPIHFLLAAMIKIFS